jgi:NAD(P)H-dependent FMN reductase
MSQVKILAISASLHPASVSRAALVALGAEVTKRGASYQLVDLASEEWSLPLFDPRRKSSPPAYEKIKALMLDSHAVVLASPDYHGGASGVMKNCLDYFWGEFAGRLFGYVCASHEKGLTVMEQMRTSVRQCYGWSLPYGLSLSESDLNTERSEITNSKVSSRVQLMAHDLCTYGPLLTARFAEDKSKPGQGFAAFYK